MTRQPDENIRCGHGYLCFGLGVFPRPCHCRHNLTRKKGKLSQSDLLCFEPQAATQLTLVWSSASGCCGENWTVSLL